MIFLLKGRLYATQHFTVPLSQKINCLETEACFDCAVQFSKYGFAQVMGSCFAFQLARTSLNLCART